MHSAMLVLTLPYSENVTMCTFIFIIYLEQSRAVHRDHFVQLRGTFNKLSTPTNSVLNKNV